MQQPHHYRALASRFATEIWPHRWLALSVALLSCSFDQIYMFSKAWMLVWRVDRVWYPHLIDSSLSWLAINPWAYRLQAYSWTSNIAWCAMLAAVTWALTRLRPRQRGLIVTVFLGSQVAVRVPYVWTGIANWLREPTNPIQFYALLWLCLMTFVAVPSSVYLGSTVSFSHSRR
jgi:hypothetical protein